MLTGLKRRVLPGRGEATFSRTRTVIGKRVKCNGSASYLTPSSLPTYFPSLTYYLSNRHAAWISSRKFDRDEVKIPSKRFFRRETAYSSFQNPISLKILDSPSREKVISSDEFLVSVYGLIFQRAELRFEFAWNKLDFQKETWRNIIIY